MKKILSYLFSLMLLAIAAFALLLFLPKTNSGNVRIKVAQGTGMAAVSRSLASEDAIYNRMVFLAAAYLSGTAHQVTPGNYRLQRRASAWQILHRIQNGRPDTITIRIIEGTTFAQMRRTINQTADIQHTSATWSDEKLLRAIGPNAPYSRPEGLFFPDSYDIDSDASDLQIYRLAYQRMQSELAKAWDNRADDLPYQTPYQLLILASIIEKETAAADDRANIAAVFINRLRIGMRLQTDPTVIYGMGNRYQGKIRRADLTRDTPYNTYTRNGLPPTPISLPGQAALEAAAHPADSPYLYFVSRMDNTGKSQFSTTLDEHNNAVRRYILKQN